MDRSSQENASLSIEEEGSFVVGDLIGFTSEIGVGKESRFSCNLDRSCNSKKQDKLKHTKKIMRG